MDSTINKQRIIPKLAYQLEEMNGGFQLFVIKLNDDNKMVSRERISDPDAWDHIILLLEAELGRQFQ